MTKDRLKALVHLWQTGRINDTNFITAVEAYSSASNNGKSLVSGRSEQLNCPNCKGTSIDTEEVKLKCYCTACGTDWAI